MMACIYRSLCTTSLVLCVLLLKLNSVYCCLPYPENAVFPRKFTFEAFPSVNVSLGDKVELRCTSNDTSNLTSVKLLSRMHSNFTPNCYVAPEERICSYLIQNVQLGDIGKYDCINEIHKDGICYHKLLVLNKVIEEPTEISTLTSTVTTMTTMKSQEHVTKHSDYSTRAPSDEATTLASLTLKHVAFILLVAVVKF